MSRTSFNSPVRRLSKLSELVPIEEVQRAFSSIRTSKFRKLTLKKEKKLKRYPNRFNRNNLTTEELEDTGNASAGKKSDKADSWLNEQSLLTDSDFEEVSNVKLDDDKFLKDLIF